MASQQPSDGKAPSDLPFGYGARAPFAAGQIPAAELEARLELGDDQCVIDDERFFLRARLPLAVSDAPQPFVWGVWVEVSEAQFDRAAELWELADAPAEPAMPCTLATQLPCYPDTLGLPVQLQHQRAGEVPSAMLEGDHVLAVEQQQGITLQRVKQIHDIVMG
jgi:hypothetical protein